MKNRKINVLIAGVGAGGNGFEILKALKASDIDYNISGCDVAKNNLGFCKTNKQFILPPANDPRYLHELVKICKNEKIEVIFTGSEPDLKAVSENRKIFEDMGIFLPLNSKEIIELCMNKKETFKKLNDEGFPTPKTISIEKSEDIHTIDFFPVVIKPYIGGGGSNNTFIAQDIEELTFFCNYILKYGGKPLIQEYMGSFENEYTVGVLSGHDKQPISVVGLRRFILSGLSNRIKIRSLSNPDDLLVISSGISQGEIIIDDNLSEQCIAIAMRLGSVGPLNIQCRYVNNKVYPFEINPRFSGTTYIRALAGVNEPDLFIKKYLLNQEIPLMPRPNPGIILRGLEEVFIHQ